MNNQRRDPHVQPYPDNSWQDESGAPRDTYQDGMYDDVSLTEDYLADQRQSEAYARAAREAQQQAQLRPERIRRETDPHSQGHYSDGHYTEGYQAQPAAYAETGPVRPRRLESEEDFQDTGRVPHDDYYQETGRISRRETYNQDERMMQPAHRGGAGRRQPARGRRQGASVSAFFLRLLQDFFGSFRLLFSRRPMNSFHQELSWQGIGLFLGLNVIIGGLLFSSLFTHSLKVLAGSVFGDQLTVGSVFFRMFAFSLLGQICFQALVFGLIFLFSAFLQSERRSLKQYFQTVAISSLPLTVIWFGSLIFSLFLSSIAFLLLFVAQSMYYIFLYAGFQKGHPSRKMSPYWLFFLIVIVTLIAQYVFLRWGIPSQLTIGSI